MCGSQWLRAPQGERSFWKSCRIPDSGRPVKTAERVLDEEQVDGVRVWISDFGALEFVIEARLRAALREAGRDGT